MTKSELKKYFANAEEINKNWHVGNDILYEMCKKYPNHKDNAEVIAKLWLIGRSYSAAIERGAKYEKGENLTEPVYEKMLPKALSEYREKIDEALSKLNKLDLHQIFSTYDLILKCFHKVSGKWNRSLASKYLHFHQPDNFYLMDSRVKKGLKYVIEALTLNIKIGIEDIKQFNVSKEIKEYEKFYIKCQKCHKALE